MPRTAKTSASVLFGTALLALAACREAPPAATPEGNVVDGTGAPLESGAEPSPLAAGFLIVDGVYNTELAAPYDVFEHTAYQSGAGGGIEVFTVSPDGAPVTTAEGLRLLPHFGFDDAPGIDILVVPSAEGSRDRDLENRPLIEWVGRTGREARFVISFCWGAFVLAEAGLLEGRAATTFPRDYRAFAERFPGVDLRINASFVHDGQALTSEGGVRSYDAAIYLVDHLFGSAVAAGVGRGLLIPWPPDPRQRPPFVSLKR